MAKKKKIIIQRKVVEDKKDEGLAGKKIKATWESTRKKFVGVEDMTMLGKVSNDHILKNIKDRFLADEIYCYIGHVLICVNPFKDLGYYRDDSIDLYSKKARIECPPHIFAIAHEAHMNMISYSEDQAIIISGESGAGKTEASKQIMQFIAAVTGSSAEANKVKNIVLESSPLLEAFGNAKTLRNDNSSRFGKYFELEFDVNGDPVGGRVYNYLLEKSRIVQQIQGERNFHIFYQLTRGAGPELADFQIQPPESYTYISAAGMLDVARVDDSKEFQNTIHAMNVMGISADEQYYIWQLLSAILWLGNMQFKQKQERSFIADKTTLAFCAYLLEVDQAMLSAVLTTRMMETTHGGKRGTVYNVPLNTSQATNARDALCKTIYSRIFDFLVMKINQALVHSDETLTIGVLDIYGFEIFDHNGFEQLCINYVNEKLQQIFIELTLKREQEEYRRENIKWEPIDYFDNKVVCDLLEGKNPPGVFSIMDDACSTAHAEGEACDVAFLQRTGSVQSHKHFDLRGKAFCIKHYAGDVVYDGMGMTDRNKDTLLRGLIDMAQCSQNSFLVSLFPEKQDKDDKKRPSSAGFKIRGQCNVLMNALMQCQPHYVRTIKPNETKQPRDFEDTRVLHQIKYLGLLENVRVRRAGWAFRQTFAKFLQHFFLLSARTSYAASFIWQGNDKDGCRAVLEDCGINKEEWQLGTTKVFIRHPESIWAMEHLKERYFENMAMRIQRMYRGWKRKKEEAAAKIQKAWKKWRGVKIYHDKKDYSQQLLQGRKERHRFSLLSMRHFHGDYLEYATNDILKESVGSLGYGESVLFTSRCQVLAGKKLSPRFLVITSKRIVLIKVELKKNLPVVTVEENQMNQVGAVNFSPLADDFMSIDFKPVPPATFGANSIILECMFKTEIATLLMWELKGEIDCNFEPDLGYNVKKKRLALAFVRDDNPRLPNQDKVFIKGKKVFVPSDLNEHSELNRPISRALKPKNKPKPQQQQRGGGAPRGGATGGQRGGAGGAPRGGAAGGQRGGAGPPPRGGAGGPPRGGAGGPPRGGAGGPPRGAAAPAPARQPPQKPMAEALYDFSAEGEGELTFRQGDMIELVDFPDAEEWWEGKLGGRQGFIPRDFVKRVKAPPAPAPAPQRAPAPAAQQQRAPAPAPAAQQQHAPAPAPAAQQQHAPMAQQQPAAQRAPAAAAAPVAQQPKPQQYGAPAPAMGGGGYGDDEGSAEPQPVQFNPFAAGGLPPRGAGGGPPRGGPPRGGAGGPPRGGAVGGPRGGPRGGAQPPGPPRGAGGPPRGAGGPPRGAVGPPRGAAPMPGGEAPPARMAPMPGGSPRSSPRGAAPGGPTRGAPRGGGPPGPPSPMGEAPPARAPPMPRGGTGGPPRGSAPRARGAAPRGRGAAPPSAY